MAEDADRAPFRELTPANSNVPLDAAVHGADKAGVLDSQAQSSTPDVDTQQSAIVAQLRQVFLKMEEIGMENTSLQHTAADLWVRAAPLQSLRHENSCMLAPAIVSHDQP